MNKNFEVFGRESSDIIASFSDAIGSVAQGRAPNRAVIAQALEASLANALSLLSASLASSVGTVGSAGFAENVKRLKKRLQSQVKLLVKATEVK